MTENTEKNPVKTRLIRPRQRNCVGLISVILDFVAKCLYPAILVYLLCLIAPAIKDVDVSKLMDRLSSAKGHGFELAFEQSEDLAAETAPLNSKITALEQTLELLQSDFKELQAGLDEPVISESTKMQRKNSREQFESNSKYSVLVFHSAAGTQAGDQITQALLKDGYQSSSTATDFSELSKQQSKGTIVVTYNAAGSLILNDIKSLISKLKTSYSVEIKDTSTNLRRGDVQVLVF